MTPEEITMEMVIAVGDDLNKILALEPPIITVFESKVKGAAKTASQKKFTEALKLEIAQIAEGQDPETKAYDLQVADIPLLQPETVEIIKILSPPAAERLNPIVENKPESKEKKQSAADFVPRFLCANPEATSEEIQKALQKVGLKMADSMISAWIRDMKRVFEELQILGKLK